jgi:hypothetical protein
MSSTLGARKERVAVKLGIQRQDETLVHVLLEDGRRLELPQQQESIKTFL